MVTKRIRTTAAVLFAGSLLFLTSCGGNNGEMPPETTTGDNMETGVQGSGDKPGTGADSANVNDVLAGEEDTTATNQ